MRGIQVVDDTARNVKLLADLVSGKNPLSGKISCSLSGVCERTAAKRCKSFLYLRIVAMSVHKIDNAQNHEVVVELALQR